MVREATFVQPIVVRILAGQSLIPLRPAWPPGVNEARQNPKNPRPTAHDEAAWTVLETEATSFDRLCHCYETLVLTSVMARPSGTRCPMAGGSARPEGAPRANERLPVSSTTQSFSSKQESRCSNQYISMGCCPRGHCERLQL